MSREHYLAQAQRCAELARHCDDQHVRDCLISTERHWRLLADTEDLQRKSPAAPRPSPPRE